MEQHSSEVVVKSDSSKGDMAKNDVAKDDAGKNDVAKGDIRKDDVAKADAAKTDVAKCDTGKNDVAKGDAGKNDVANGDAGKNSVGKGDVSTNEVAEDLDVDVEQKLDTLMPVWKAGDPFNEEQAEQQVLEKLGGVKEISRSKAIRGWLSRMFQWKETKPFNPPTLTDSEFKERAKVCLEECWELLHRNDWRRHKVSAQDTVEVLAHPVHGKIFKLQGVVECPAQLLFEEFRDNVDGMSKWNPNILESKLIRRISSSTDLTYQVTAGGGGGAVRPRDFVNLRHAAVRGNWLLSCATSVQLISRPPDSKYIRGENNVSCWAMEPLPGNTACHFVWLMGCNLKGWIPQGVLDVAFTTAMLEFMQHLRKLAKDKLKGC